MCRPAVLVGVALLAGCEPGTEPVRVAGVEISPTAATLYLGPGGGQSVQLSAAAVDADGDTLTGFPITWSLSDSVVATVSPSGLLVATSVGVTMVRAHAGGQVGELPVAVTLVPVHSVELDVESVTLALGPTIAEDRQFTVVARDSTGAVLTGRGENWLLTDAAIGSVTSQGLLIVEDVGTTSLIIDIEGVRDTAIVQVEEPPNAWAVLSVGGDHACAIDSVGATWCWGANHEGQLGLGSGVASAVTRPMRLTTGISFATISAGLSHTCGLTTGGAAYCWGNGSNGQLGDGAQQDRNQPTAVSGDLTFVSIVTASTQTCALTAAGGAWCWGEGSRGDGTLGYSIVPAPAAPSLSFVALALGWNHACGLTATGEAYCWGDENMLGDGEDGESGALPQLVLGGHVFSQLASGGWTTCGLTSVGGAHCWGYNPSTPFDPNIDTWNHVPAPAATAHAFERISVGHGVGQICGATLTNGGPGPVVCWGDNEHGQLGDGTTEHRAEPFVLDLPTGITALGSGGTHGCALGAYLDCWGFNMYGNLGDGTSTTRGVPGRVRTKWPR